MTDANTYTCAYCNGTFEKGWTDDEAKAEYDAVFGGLPEGEKDNPAVVCDDCYQEMIAEYSPSDLVRDWQGRQ